MSFREYIQQNIDGAMFLEPEHLDSVTFDDICVLIHLMTTQNQDIELSRKLREHPDYQKLERLDYARIMTHPAAEEIAVLYCFATRMFHEPGVFFLYTENEGVRRQYLMSSRFIEAAKRCGVYEYPITKKIISFYDIPYHYSTESGSEYLRQYLNIQKSAAKTS